MRSVVPTSASTSVGVKCGKGLPSMVTDAPAGSVESCSLPITFGGGVVTLGAGGITTPANAAVPAATPIEISGPAIQRPTLDGLRRPIGGSEPEGVCCIIVGTTTCRCAGC